MPELIKYQLEYPIHSSINILYKRLSNPSGLSEWFADDVHIRHDVYTFFWDGSEQTAIVLKKKENQFMDRFLQIFGIVSGALTTVVLAKQLTN